MANIITSCRILCSAVILFFPAFSPVFYVLYCLAGFTDMVDGAVARKTDTISEAGSRLDTIADIVFAAVCMIKMLPVLSIPVWLWIGTGVVAAIKVINVISGYIVQKKFVAEHTVMNKITGVMLFILPFTLSFIDLNYSGGVVCAAALFAAVQEGHLIRKNEKFD
ncbi:MAG: CDP-alcohol phosphatidyltransferase family protein [Ruminococcus sp.]